MKAVRQHFRPEFFNRLDEIILFHRLSRENMDKIVDIQSHISQCYLQIARSRLC